MQQIRIFNQHVNPGYVLLGLLEFPLLLLSAWLGLMLRFGGDPQALEINMQGAQAAFLAFAVVLSACNIAMRTYEARFREGFSGMALRTLVAYFLLGSAAMLVLQGVSVLFYLGDGVLLLAIPIAFALVMLLRLGFFWAMDDSRFARRVLVLGAGERALRLCERLLKGGERAGLDLVGYLPVDGATVQVPLDQLVEAGGSLLETARAHGVNEVIVAVDERRRSEGGSFPMRELLDCKLAGIAVLDQVSFLERELDLVEIDLVSPHWLVFADGFRFSARRDASKRVFDLAASLTLLLVAWPFMLLTALAIWIESGFRGPILYRQDRVGYGGRVFKVVKFRSMRTDAEMQGAVWARKNDDRITRVGRIIRATRLDELPQLWNVLQGRMSFVGPRPERPEFVGPLEEQIPYYAERHRVKPGLAGWAQLCYPYGASVEDAAEKLRYDLYYVKNHNIMMDLLILVQTVEVVLVGKGAR